MPEEAPTDDVQAAVARYLRYRREADEGLRPWTDLVELFTDDAVLVDPAWGRVEGIKEIERFLLESMAGIDDWRFPVDAVYMSGAEVILKYRQVMPARRPDGRPYEQSGYSTLLYAGQGRFCFEEDVLNMAHVSEDLRAMNWRPPPELQMPPQHPDRNFARPV